MHLTVSLTGSGFHPASWRMSRLKPVPNAAAIQAMACTAERGGLDAILLGLPAGNAMRLDPLPLLGSLIAVTRRIGLGASWTIDYTEPYNVARVFATLDHLSYGRTAWIARMFDGVPLEERIGRPNGLDDLPAYCQRAGEFVDVVKKLLDSWEDEGFALDKASGMFADPGRVHAINHAGRYFTVRGPLNVPRPPQGIPVLIVSDPVHPTGRRFVAVTADVVLTDRVSMREAADRYQELHALAGSVAPRILANINFVLGATEAEARKRIEALDAFSARASDGMWFAGTPEQLTELLATWQQHGACDGFNLLPAVLPDDLDLFADAVVPLVRRRGLVRADYDGSTLREHLGLSRPISQYTGRAMELPGS
jgi:alkanesulfonate monooxygenase SsuD/methylene tetrahydromethanopterin reductase-like flavin-dependent oxidoreductase (luciferase family)